MTLFSLRRHGSLSKTPLLPKLSKARTPNSWYAKSEEEAVRQLYLFKLFHEYGYPTSRIEVEFPIHFGREVKRADIAIMDKDRPMVPYIVVELKKPKLSDGKEQLKSYCNATGAPIGVWTNGEQLSYYNRKDPNYFEPITNIPKVSEKLSDIINEKFTYEDLKRLIESASRNVLSAPLSRKWKMKCLQRWCGFF